MKAETMTLVLVNLASIMESADEKLVPAVYKELGAALHTDPTGLGTLTLYRSIVQTSCYPLAVYLALRYNRAHVIALGAFLWATATFLVAISSTFFQVAVSRGLNGVGLAIVIPAIQSFVADSTDVNNRGTAFGWLYLTGKLGSITGGFFAVLLASTSFMGITGWRIAFLVVGIVSVIVGILLRIFANDPHFPKSDSGANGRVIHKHFWSDVKELIQEANSVIRIPSFQIIVAQGVSGSFPGSALSFAPMWLELLGFSHEKTAFLWTILVVGASFGGLFGGRMGDILAKRLPNSGRIILSQISSASAVPLAAVLLLVPPDDPSSAFMHGLVLFIMGFFTSWEAAATNNPIFAEIVPEKSRTSVYPLDRTFETILASFVPYVVGILAQHVYGYKPIPKGSSNSADAETDRQNAASLAKALYTAIGIPAAICCFIYSLLYCTYPRDCDRARMVALIESEMQVLEVPPSSEIDIAYEGENSLDLDDNDDESSLLSR
ncbi:uncharacterized protein LOC122303609 isoform X1 [Carya illinoinensis]|uniref:uncharacterized protein LOC122303609 isoform X1 n=1 Tax=Carya illinoinensis TaxID=32201 RepID=UPI001C7282F9|nr:uncharacterized protein LOC122303609 isoform X1 [Carya illinoinensis]XP_042971383.1 uncharacterized protein LOC122303609 isoform X1 [Carya illinoinensis]